MPGDLIVFLGFVSSVIAAVVYMEYWTWQLTKDVPRPWWTPENRMRKLFLMLAGGIGFLFAAWLMIAAVGWWLG